MTTPRPDARAAARADTLARLFRLLEALDAWHGVRGERQERRLVEAYERFRAPFAEESLDT